MVGPIHRLVNRPRARVDRDVGLAGDRSGARVERDVGFAGVDDHFIGMGRDQRGKTLEKLAGFGSGWVLMGENGNWSEIE